MHRLNTLKFCSFFYIKHIIIFLPFLLYSDYISAQQILQNNSNEVGSRIIYDIDFFKPYNPVSAEDMLRKIPGTEGLLQTYGFNQDDKRGLRSNTDQILINGKRLTGKQVKSSVFLSNLPAVSVKRIELITGNVRELDTEVGSRVINVILKEDASTGSGVIEGGITAWNNGPEQLSTALSYNGDFNGISYTTSFSIKPFSSSVDIIDVFKNPEGETLSREKEAQRPKQLQYLGRGSISYDTVRGNVSLNGLIDHLPVNKRYTTNFFSNSSDNFSIPTGNFIDKIDGENTKWEISGDVTYNFNKVFKLTTLFVYSNAINDRNNTNFENINDDIIQLGGDNRDKTESEKIIRTTFDLNLNKNNQIELGIEGAINTLDKSIDFYNIVDGTQAGIPIINADQEITEDRIEVFSTYSWKPFNSLEIETGLAGEFSKLNQIGSDVSSSRSLKFIKPSFNIFYNYSPNSQFYLSINRNVGQLDFNDFIATVNREDNEILAGNPSLVPEKDWNFDLGVEYRLPRSSGVLNGRAFYRIVNDAEDLIPLGINDSQPGNLGTGKDYGLEVKASVRFSNFTKVDAVLSGSFLLRKSSIEDPFTFEKRRFGNQPEYEFKVEGSHDVKSLGLRYGFDYSKKGPEIESDFNEFDDKSTSSGLRVYLRKRIAEGKDLSLYWANALEQKTYRKRNIFNPSQISGNIEEVQFREYKRLFIYGFRLRSTF